GRDALGAHVPPARPLRLRCLAPAALGAPRAPPARPPFGTSPGVRAAEEFRRAAGRAGVPSPVAPARTPRVRLDQGTRGAAAAPV
ncbi:hypothetical protein Nmel_005597, partial [Mimus melanotis]